MGRLVVVSNRLPKLTPAAGVPDEVPAGGLVTALLGALRRTPGSLWIGWNGRVVADSSRAGAVSRQTVQGVDLLGFPLTKEEMDGYYLGFCNETLWPLLHCFQGRARIGRADERRYRAVQTRVATIVRRVLQKDDLVWVHDYHLLLLGREMRRLGWHDPIGFFLHTPFPPHEHVELLPDPRDFLEAMLSYDLVGFQVDGFLDNYLYSCWRELEARWDGSILTALSHVQRAGVYPVGVEPEDFAGGRRGAEGRARSLIPRLRDRRLLLGVDRLDYTKGIAERVLGFERFLKDHPEWRKKVVYVQIASPSRAILPEYARQKRRVDALIGRVNGEMSEHDWVPIRYLYRTYPPDFLADLYRRADVMLVTPLRDGMNLVAKEFVASQGPDAPGVLVLSRCAGAAQEMREALMVNPLVISDLAEGIQRALTMPLAERRWRQEVLLSRVRSGRASEWSRRFLEDLARGGLGDASAADTLPPGSMSASQASRLRQAATRTAS